MMTTVRYLQGSLSPLLEHGSSSLERVTRMYQHNLWRQQQPILQGPAAPGLPPLLDPLEPALSFCVGAHCSTCSMQDKCVARLTHAGGELQLSGCSADQAEKLCAYWDEDHENGITSLLDLGGSLFEAGIRDDGFWKARIGVCICMGHKSSSSGLNNHLFGQQLFLRITPLTTLSA
eukprot:1150553-Pelagomonas_calceolata.AAC.8